MILQLAASVLGVVLFYACWQVLVSTWSRLQQLGIENKYSSTQYFDRVSLAGVLGIFVARIIWMILNAGLYAEVPWGLLPYSRSASGLVWFAVFPWRVFWLAEGLFIPAVWATVGVILTFTLFLPTVRLVRKLRLEVRGVMRAFLLRLFLCELGMVSYLSLLIYLTW